MFWRLTYPCCVPTLFLFLVTHWQVNRGFEPRSDPVVVSTEADKAFVAELVQLVTDWLDGKQPSSTSSSLWPMENGIDAAAADASRTGCPPGPVDEGPAAAAAATVDASGQQLQLQLQQELVLPALNSYKRLLAYQELRKPQFGVEGHPGFWIKKVSTLTCRLEALGVRL